MTGMAGWSGNLPFLSRALFAGAAYTAVLTYTIAGWRQMDGAVQYIWMYAIVVIGGLAGPAMAAVVRLPKWLIAGCLGTVAAVIASRLALTLVPPPVPDVESAGSRVVAVAAGALAYAAAAWAAAGAGGRRTRIVVAGVTLAVLASMAVARGPVTAAYRERAIVRLGAPAVTAAVSGLPFRGARLKWPRDEEPGRGVPALRLEYAEPYEEINGPESYVRIYLWGGAAPPPRTACRTVVERDEREDHLAYTPCRKAGGDRWIRDEKGDPGEHADVFGTYRGALIRVAGFHEPDDGLLATLNSVRPAAPRFLAEHWSAAPTGPLPVE